MKFALCNELFTTWNTDNKFDFPRVFDYVKKCGYDGIEIAPFTIKKNVFDISKAHRSEIRRLAEATKLEITGLHWLLAQTDGYHLTSPDAIVRQKTADYFLELIRLCSDLGGHFMILGSPQQRNLLPGVSKEDAVDYATALLLQLVPMLEKYDVQIALEPLSPKETTFLGSAAEAVQLIEKIGAPHLIALHLDCKAMCSETVPIPELIQIHKERLVYVHLNDPNLQGPGFGHLDFVPIMKALLDVDYEGWTSVEVFDTAPGIEVLAEKSLTYIKRCLGAAASLQ